MVRVFFLADFLCYVHHLDMPEAHAGFVAYIDMTCCNSYVHVFPMLCSCCKLIFLLLHTLVSLLDLLQPLVHPIGIS
jgi:hypothetical protein